MFTVLSASSGGTPGYLGIRRDLFLNLSPFGVPGWLRDYSRVFESV